MNASADGATALQLKGLSLQEETVRILELTTNPLVFSHHLPRSAVVLGRTEGRVTSFQAPETRIPFFRFETWVLRPSSSLQCGALESFGLPGVTVIVSQTTAAVAVAVAATVAVAVAVAVATAVDYKQSRI